MISEEVSSVSAKRVHIAVYVTNHGFGHVNRLMAVLNQIAPEVRVTVRADKEIWPAIEERLHRPVEFGYFPSDLGTVSPPGQNSQTDWPATFERLANRYREIQAACQEEVEWLKSACITSVYADASPIPIRLAHEAGLTGYLGANFTWDEIYADLLATAPEGLFTPDQTAQYQAIVDDMRSACAQATLLRFWPYTQMSAKVREVVDMGLVINEGRDVRAELLSKFNLTADSKLVYFYVGRYGVEELPWDRLTEYPPNIIFIGLHPPGKPLPGRFVVVDPNEYSGADLLRSCDAAIAKAGYGAVAEAMAVGTPVIYPPREGFVEFPALDHALRNWAGGQPVSESEFRNLSIHKVLEAALQSRVGAPSVSLDGAQKVANILVNGLTTEISEPE